MKKGYSITAGDKVYFLETETAKKTKGLVVDMMTKVGAKRGLCEDLINRCIESTQTIDEFRYRMSKTTLTIKGENDWKYYSLTGDNFTMNIPLKESECLIIL